MRRKFGRPSPALVIASIALFVALAGGAWAVSHAPKNSVTAKSIKNGAVKTKKIKDEAVTTEKLADDAVTTQKLADDAVTSAKVKNGTIGESDLTAYTTTDATLINGWIAVGTAPVPTFGKDALGFVHLRGTLRNPGGNATNGTVGFTLPTGMRPERTEQFPAAQIFGGASSVCVITVGTDGSVVLGINASEATGCHPVGTISVSGITFKATG